MRPHESEPSRNHNFASLYPSLMTIHKLKYVIIYDQIKQPLLEYFLMLACFLEQVPNQ